MADDSKPNVLKALQLSGVLDTSIKEAPAPKKPAPLSYVLNQALADKNNATVEKKSDDPSLNGRLAKSILNVLNGGKHDSIESLAFERDPSQSFETDMYQPKVRLVPDIILKRIAIQDDLIATIVHTRGNHIAQMGRVPEDRFSMGFKFVQDVSRTDKFTPEQKEELQKRMDNAVKQIMTCGSTEQVALHDRCSFSEYLYQSVRNGLIVGRSATEVRFSWGKDGEKKFHSWRPIDGGTIFRASNKAKAAQDSVREQAKNMLERILNKDLKKEPEHPDEYAWVQVIEGKVTQVFSEEELLVHNFYPVTDVELLGYPLTPIDTMLAAVTTHINITNHNKAYFQSGRATRGMLVIKSQDINMQLIEAMRQQFNASINGVQNAWRMPVFGCGPEDAIDWQPLDQGSRDMEFQYLSDTNARVILSAFQMSPEELPGYQHLSRGTNNQSLSEGNNEYKLEAARDVGIRPLIAQLEDFINTYLVPLIDPTLAKIAKLKFVGMDRDTLEKETIHIQQWSSVYGSMNRILDKVELDQIPPELGGDFPLNQTYWEIVKQYCTFGQILEFWFKIPNASKDPRYQFYQNPDWMNFQQMQQAQQQAAQQQQMAAQQGPPQEGGQQPQPEGEDTQKSELGTSIDQLISLLAKGEQNMSPSKKKLKAHQRVVNRHILDAWEQDSHKTLTEIADLADQQIPDDKE